MQLDSELSFQYVSYSSYSCLKLDHTVADCMVFTWTPCRMLDYFHQDLLFKWLDNWATKELELHVLGLELFWNTLLHFGKSRSSASGTLSIENLPSFALKDVLFFIYI
uniref:Uncharacterized protein n=1 Tax=Saimiri boliviensis boliviensis TaxID=39432 RepID=A0A2K6UQ49_SAIBB